MNRGDRIRNILETELKPLELQVENESDQHSGPPGRETHFRVRIVSVGFAGLSRVRRQQLVYGLLRAELDSGLHALGLQTLTPEEAGRDEIVSPKCASKNKS